MKLSQEVMQAVREAHEPPNTIQVQQIISDVRKGPDNKNTSKPLKLMVWWNLKRLDGRELESFPLVRDMRRRKHYKVRSGALGQH